MVANGAVTIYDIIILVGGIQGLLLSAFLVFHKKGINTKSNRILGLLIFTQAADMVMSYLTATGVVFRYPALIFLTDPLFVLMGPLLYLFVGHMIRHKDFPRKRHILLFLPFTAEVFWYFGTLMGPQDVRISLLQSTYLISTPPGIYALVWGGELLFNLILTGAAVGLLVQSRRRTKASTGIAVIDSRLLLTGVVTTAVLYFSFQLMSFFLVFTGEAAVTDGFGIIYICLSFLFYVLGYRALSESRTFTRSEAPLEGGLRHPERKYAKSALSQNGVDQGLQKILTLMENEKLYLQNDIRISDLADRLGESSNHVSQIINSRMKKNFHDFINEYRVTEAKRLLAGPGIKTMTILGLATAAGFNSKSTFNKTFKGHTGMTPSEYSRRFSN